MPEARKHLSPQVEREVVVRSGRRCCLCVFLDGDTRHRKGQIAHLNRKRSDNRFANLVWLCLEHHDEYDSRTSQSKGLTIDEVRHYRDKLLRLVQGERAIWPETIAIDFIDDSPSELDAAALPNTRQPGWRYPLWQVADRFQLFAYKAPMFDGVCLIERIDLPDDRVVIACAQPPGNPGTSITNCAEKIASQVCARFEIPVEQLVWLENYPGLSPDEWDLVTFAEATPDGQLEGPNWTPMTDAAWLALGLRVDGTIKADAFDLVSNIIKLFDRCDEDA